MTRKDLSIVVQGITPVLKRLSARIDELERREQKQPVNGKDGSSIQVGYGPPTFEGRADDVYVDVQSGDIYQCR